MFRLRAERFASLTRYTRFASAIYSLCKCDIIQRSRIAIYSPVANVKNVRSNKSSRRVVRGISRRRHIAWQRQISQIREDLYRFNLLLKGKLNILYSFRRIYRLYRLSSQGIPRSASNRYEYRTRKRGPRRRRA